jgi:hypothetical protein
LRVFVTKAFRRFQRKEQIADAALCEAIARAEQGLIDADLGSGLIKQRVARKGQGRSGGFRTLIAYKTAVRSVFLFGFAKSERDNISAEDKRELVETGSLLMRLDPKGITALLEAGEVWEIECDVEDKAQVSQRDR